MGVCHKDPRLLANGITLSMPITQLAAVAVVSQKTRQTRLSTVNMRQSLPLPKRYLITSHAAFIQHTTKNILHLQS